MAHPLIPVGVPYFTNMETIAHRSSKFQTNKLKSETKKSEEVAVPAAEAAAAALASAPVLFFTNIKKQVRQ